jgi:hypothetical protein
MTAFKNLPDKSGFVYTLCLFPQLSLSLTTWKANAASELRISITLSIGKNKLEEPEFLRISLIRAVMPPQKCETLENNILQKYLINCNFQFFYSPALGLNLNNHEHKLFFI